MNFADYAGLAIPVPAQSIRVLGAECYNGADIFSRSRVQ